MLDGRNLPSPLLVFPRLKTRTSREEGNLDVGNARAVALRNFMMMVIAMLILLMIIVFLIMSRGRILMRKIFF